ncbi:MAG: hypothetical protein ACD_62C00561G0004 [uncultured bacterium]|nr:MAG: hypothetical protein ACD_62C00561G0004 [uncultured bacterium]
MGNDEHSANVQKAAIEKGMTPKAYCDNMRPKFEHAWKQLNISYDQFIQTSELRHHASVSRLFEKIYESGDIYPRDYEGWYCESCEAFYTEKDLVDGLCPNHKTKPKWLKEQNYFFKLTKYSDFLLNHIENNPDFILPKKRRNEVISFIKQGLEDISISRSSFNWGIPLPIKKDHVIYVWFDALINYITGIGYGEDNAQFAPRWENVTHIIGKDITRFHCIIWPCMLKSAGIKLPKTILGHGFVYLKGEKMSKSLGNVVGPLDVTETYPDFGSDALRYYLMRGSSFGDDSDFTWDNFIERYNADLANGLGNLVSRTLGMVWRYQQGTIRPLPSSEIESTTLLSLAGKTFEVASNLIRPEVSGDCCFHTALEKIWAFITQVDQYIDQKAPWTLSKEKRSEELSVVLTTLVEAVRLISLLVLPFIPATTQKIWAGFGFDSLQALEGITCDSLNNTLAIKTPHQLKTDKLMLFPRIETKNERTNGRMDDGRQTSGTASEQAKPESGRKETPVSSSASHDSRSTIHDPQGNLIDIADFGKLDLRVARVLTAQKVEKADKLLRLEIEIDGEQRQIVAGIAEFYTPEDMIGKNIVVVANLKPATIRGIESRGMLLAAKKGKELCLVTPEKLIATGAKVG